MYPNYMLQSENPQYFNFQCCYGMWMFVLCERSLCTVDRTKISKINFVHILLINLLFSTNFLFFSSVRAAYFLSRNITTFAAAATTVLQNHVKSELNKFRVNFKSLKHI